jgi:uncharacterized membrane protein HdeD (DUF308 family)
MDKNRDIYHREKEYKLFHDKRKDSDFWVMFIRTVGVLNWIIIIAVGLIVDSWFPKDETFFDRLFNISRNDFWRMDITPLLVFLMAAMFICSGIALIANTRRLKRDGDSFNLSNLLGFIVSWIAIIAYFSM